MKAWLRRWLGITSSELFHSELTLLHEEMRGLRREIELAKSELVKLQVERYVPPVEQEPEKKVRIARTSKEFRDLTEREPTEDEIYDASRFL